MRITLEEIARMANVSKTTVSRVINGITTGVGDNTRKRILNIIDDLGCGAGDLVSGRSGSTKTIGMVVPDMTNPFFSSVAMEVGRCTAGKGYTVLMCGTGTSPGREEAAISTLIAKRVDGIILISVFSDWQDSHQRMDKYHIPCVLLDRNIQGDPAMGVFVDNEYAFFMATSHFIRCGHYRVALIGGPESAPTTRERVAGYRSAFEMAGIRYDETLIRYGGFDMETGYRSVMEMAGEHIRYTAVITGNDSIAVGVMRALKRMNVRVPGDMELIGFDDTQLAEIVEPPLTTIKQPVDVLAKTAVDMLLRTISGDEPEEKVVRLKSSLILRGTTRSRPDSITL